LIKAPRINTKTNINKHNKSIVVGQHTHKKNERIRNKGVRPGIKGKRGVAQKAHL